MRRGLTMVELLASLTLMTLIMVAVAGWTQVTARASSTSAAPLRWRNAAETVLDRIGDDLWAGDLGEGATAPLELVDGELRITTRATSLGGVIGPVANRYGLELLESRLVLEQRDLQDRRHQRPLLADVGRWHCELDEAAEHLLVEIESHGGAVASRRYALK